MSTSKQTFIYNSSAPVPNVNNPFTVESSALIKAAGLEEEIQVYFSAGTCFNCGPNDILWEPLFINGEPVFIGPENNHIVLAIPGKYSLGDPSTTLALTGDVNITKQENVLPWQLPYVNSNCESTQEVCTGNREWKSSESIFGDGNPTNLPAIPIDADSAILQVRNASIFIFGFFEPGDPLTVYQEYTSGFPLRITVNADLERFTFITDGEIIVMYFGEI